MPAVIRFEEFEAFEEYNEAVIKILENADIPEGSYPATRSFPPIYIVSELDNDSPAVEELRELGGVIVDIEGDDE